jgi:hypothetical protein
VVVRVCDGKLHLGAADRDPHVRLLVAHRHERFHQAVPNLPTAVVLDFVQQAQDVARRQFDVIGAGDGRLERRQVGVAELPDFGEIGR